MFFTVMDTPGMTAPVASVMVPSKVPRNVCALRIDADTAARRNESTTSREIVRMTLSPSREFLAGVQQRKYFTPCQLHLA
jgi:hypothetical protein